MNQVENKMIKKIQHNLVIAIMVMFYFFILNMAYTHMELARLLNDVKVFSMAFLITGILFLEKAYRKEETRSAIYAIELFVLAGHTLSISLIIGQFDFQFQLYLLTSSYIFGIYYVLKCIFIYTQEKRKYLRSLSDIPEITKKEEPIIKEAKKKHTNKGKQQETEGTIQEDTAKMEKQTIEKINKLSEETIIETEDIKVDQEKSKKRSNKQKNEQKNESKGKLKNQQQKVKEEMDREKPKYPKKSETVEKNKKAKVVKQKKEEKKEKEND